MMDGRRHSVDIPISKALVALRRVRSLRDPSTNSMSKFSSPVENVNWETNSGNDISMLFLNTFQEGGSDNRSCLRPKNSDLYGQREDCLDDFELNLGLEKSRLILPENSEWVGRTGSPRSNQGDEFDLSGSDKEEVFRNKSLSQRYKSSHMDNGLALTCVKPLEDVDYEEAVRSSCLERVDQIASKRKSQCKNRVDLSGAIGDRRSRTGSPCLSAGDAPSSHGTPIFANEEVGIGDHDHPGGGVSCCWSRTPRFREANISFDADDHPLLYKNVDDISFYDHRSLKGIGNETNSQLEKPRSLSQKFRPKSFIDLVGQNVVARSLLGAISRGRITSFYLFHGPQGTGKTSASRIFAAALNCLSLEEYRPCGLCCECNVYFSGNSRDIKEIDSVRINRRDRVRSLIKNAAMPPVSSRFKVFIIDECHLMRGETWVTILSSIDNLSKHVVFVMITPDLDKLPRNAVSRSQRYHFPKIKDGDIASKLGKICVEEGLEFDQVALNFIAAKSNGSLRDAEMMLDQLSLLGKKITMGLAYELIGAVSDDELLDLLDLALSSDTSNTVIRARELMRSRIDPMQLISQLANLIMDILAGEEGGSEVKKQFSRRHTSEMDFQKLSHALKIFSETEKQLRVSKNQTTWLTAALLQLSSAESSSSLDASDTKSLRNTQERGQSFKNLDPTSCNVNASDKLGMQKDIDEQLESIWKRAIDLCQSRSFKNFLRKQGRLSSLFVNQGLAIAELEFCHPDYVSKAEKSWKIIASALQSLFGCNVEIRINLVRASESKYANVKKPSFRLFSCSRRMQQKSPSFCERGSGSDYSEYTSEKPILSDRPVLPCSCDCASQLPHNCCDKMVVVSTLRNSEGNILSTRTASSCRSFEDDTPKAPGLMVDSSREEGSNQDCQVLSFHQPEHQPRCFPRTLRIQKKLCSADATQVTCCTKLQNKFAIRSRTSFEACLLGSDSYAFCSGSDNGNNTDNYKGELKEYSGVLCWKTPTLPSGKDWQLRHQQQNSKLVGWVLPCATA
ncbi:protein STICHEL-like 2 [Rosa sericea]